MVVDRRGADEPETRGADERVGARPPTRPPERAACAASIGASATAAARKAESAGLKTAEADGGVAGAPAGPKDGRLNAAVEATARFTRATFMYVIIGKGMQGRETKHKHTRSTPHKQIHKHSFPTRNVRETTNENLQKHRSYVCPKHLCFPFLSVSPLAHQHLFSRRPPLPQPMTTNAGGGGQRLGKSKDYSGSDGVMSSEEMVAMMNDGALKPTACRP